MRLRNLSDSTIQLDAAISVAPGGTLDLPPNIAAVLRGSIGYFVDRKLLREVEG